MEELPAGTTDDGLLEHCFGENASRGKGKRTINVDEMSASSGLFAKIIKVRGIKEGLANAANARAVALPDSGQRPNHFYFVSKKVGI